MKEAVPAAPEAIPPMPATKNNCEEIHRPAVASPTPTVCSDPPAVSNNPPVISAARNEPIGLKVADFLPVSKAVTGEVRSLRARLQLRWWMRKAICQIRKGHDTMCMVLTSRLRSLETTSMDSAVALNDLSVVVDLLNIINQKASLWKLDLCLTVLPQIDKKLLQSKYESYVQTGCVSLRLILQRFLPLISETLSAPPSVGVDITREERLMKCKLCYKLLKGLSVLVAGRVSQSGRNGSTFRELQLLMCRLDERPSL
ncbi:unnamed protein product, partial [Ranitomeya imitator]